MTIHFFLVTGHGLQMFPTAKKSLGQNFLVDESVAARIIAALGPRADETIVEIGPGRGALTAKLAEQAGHVVAFELDRQLLAVLTAKLGTRGNLSLVEADALAVDFCAAIAPATQARVVANLPYNISTALLQRLLAQRACLPEFVLMLQREVVARITAPPGASERGYLSVLVEAYCAAERLFDVPPGAFRPVPKVWSTVVRLRVRATPAAAQLEDESLLRKIVGVGFAQRRKTMGNNLRAAPDELRALLAAVGGADRALEHAQIEPRRRAETLTLEEWLRLVRALAAAQKESL